MPKLQRAAFPAAKGHILPELACTKLYCVQAAVDVSRQTSGNVPDMQDNSSVESCHAVSAASGCQCVHCSGRQRRSPSWWVEWIAHNATQ
eukprot:354734-Chlamydomonas_euryale.AAC.6